jgi:pimeloyl-ACP methyl ester carboxylesterase
LAYEAPQVIQAELVTIPADPDTAALDGLYYEPASGTRAAVQLMHGNGGNFYTGPCRFLPPYLGRIGLSCLSYNRRGHDTITCRTREPGGNAFQTVAQSVTDNEHARRFLAGRGHLNPVVIGHSNGGLLAARYVADHPGTPALVLLSAHCGGPEMLQRASALGLLAGDQLPQLSQRAHQLVAEGRPGTLLLMPGWWYATSAGSFADMEANLPRLLDVAPQIRCPVLYLRGEQENRDLYPAEQFADKAGGPVDVRILPGTGHFYTGREADVGRVAAEWLDRILPGERPA